MPDYVLDSVDRFVEVNVDGIARWQHSKALNLHLGRRKDVTSSLTRKLAMQHGSAYTRSMVDAVLVGQRCNGIMRIDIAGEERDIGIASTIEDADGHRWDILGRSNLRCWCAHRAPYRLEGDSSHRVNRAQRVDSRCCHSSFPAQLCGDECNAVFV